MERHPELSPIEQLLRGTAELLTPGHIHAALNSLDPRSPEAIMDAELVMGYAVWGSETYPDNPDWQHALESSLKILEHRITVQQQT